MLWTVTTSQPCSWLPQYSECNPDLVLFFQWMAKMRMIMPWRSISVWHHLTGMQTTLTVIFILVLTRSSNWGACSVGQVIRAALLKTHPLSGWSSAAWLQPSHWLLALPALGSSWPRMKNPTWLMGFKPKTFWPAVWQANHYATRASVPVTCGLTC